MDADQNRRDIISDVIGTSAEIVYLEDVRDPDRSQVLTQASALLSRNTAKELHEGEAGKLRNARLIQYVSAGVDFIPLNDFPSTTMIAGNGGRICRTHGRTCRRTGPCRL